MFLAVVSYQGVKGLVRTKLKLLMDMDREKLVNDNDLASLKCGLQKIAMYVHEKANMVAI